MYCLSAISHNVSLNLLNTDSAPHMVVRAEPLMHRFPFLVPSRQPPVEVASIVLMANGRDLTYEKAVHDH